MTQRGGRAAGLVVALLLVLLAACGDDEPTINEVGTPPPTDSPGVVGAVVKTADVGTFGVILVDSTGKSLYTFDRDTSSTSMCTGGCATTWPPLLLPSGVASPTGTGVTGALAVSPRPDGTGSQVTYNGKPLYQYAADTAAGDVRGDGVGGNWHVAKP